MILSRDDVYREIRSGNIRIDPFEKKNLGTNSLDVTLGETFFWVAPNERFFGPIVIPTGNYVYLPNGGTILAHTIERIYSDGIIVSLQARSTVGRCGITICRDAGFGDNRYDNHWTLELTGYLLGGCARWKIGETIAQAVFEKLQTNPDGYHGQYKINDWPICMIPKSFRDRVYPAKQWMIDWLSKGITTKEFDYVNL